MKTFLKSILAVSIVILTACSQKSDGLSVADSTIALYSTNGREVRVSFAAKYRTTSSILTDLENITEFDKSTVEDLLIPETLLYLFGPLTERSIGGPKRDAKIIVDWKSAKKLENGEIELGYQYSATWLVKKSIQSDFELPVPFNTESTFSEKWKVNCGDHSPSHQTRGFYWYYWDPNRYGCDQKLDEHYQIVTVTQLSENIPTLASYPQYADLLKSAGKENNLAMTFAFGYVTDKTNSDPQTDTDSGMLEYQKFVRIVRSSLVLKKLKATETPILQKEYKGAVRPEQKIGVRFVAKKGDVTVTIKVVAAAEIDQMELFAKSYAHDHDGFFGWFGHSRVGSGFDSANFQSMVISDPDYYSITPNYQIIYWGGCNSYSYYSSPFFENKANANPLNDPKGTKGLDIISNVLPSYFSYNAANARMAFDSLLNWERNDSYQTIVNKIDKYALSRGSLVLVNVLGDEDNVATQ